MSSFILQKLKTDKAAALVSVLIFIILTSMIAVSSIYLMTNQARLIEKQIRRIRSFYSCQAATIVAMDELYQAAAVTPTLNINAQTVNINHNPASVPPGLLSTTVDFSF